MSKLDFLMRYQIERIVKRTVTWTRVVILFALLGALIGYQAHGAEPMTDLPREQPLTSTAFVYCEPSTSKKLIAAVVVTYKSGKIVRFDIEHMHGMQSTAELAKYADSATDSQIYAVGLCSSTAT